MTLDIPHFPPDQISASIASMFAIELGNEGLKLWERMPTLEGVG
jgi:hypothetical protein